MEISTKSLIHKCLKAVGLNGFGGNLIKSSGGQNALEAFLSDVLEGESSANKQKVYRNLIRQSLVHIAKTPDGEYRVTITPAGAYRLSKESLNEIIVPPMEKWDSKWRLICYDLPSVKKSERYELTKHLNRMGFYPLQKSMWAHPYIFVEQLEQITESLLIKKYVTVLEVTKLDVSSTSKLMEKFGGIL